MGFRIYTPDPAQNSENTNTTSENAKGGDREETNVLKFSSVDLNAFQTFMLFEFIRVLLFLVEVAWAQAPWWGMKDQGGGEGKGGGLHSPCPTPSLLFPLPSGPSSPVLRLITHAFLLICVGWRSWPSSHVRRRKRNKLLAFVIFCCSFYCTYPGKQSSFRPARIKAVPYKDNSGKNWPSPPSPFFFFFFSKSNMKYHQWIEWERFHPAEFHQAVCGLLSLQWICSWCKFHIF